MFLLRKLHIQLYKMKLITNNYYLYTAFIYNSISIIRLACIRLIYNNTTIK